MHSFTCSSTGWEEQNIPQSIWCIKSNTTRGRGRVKKTLLWTQLILSLLLENKMLCFKHEACFKALHIKMYSLHVFLLVHSSLLLVFSPGVGFGVPVVIWPKCPLLILQEHRNRVFHDFRNGLCRNLVCTGTCNQLLQRVSSLHSQELDCRISFTSLCVTYVHRSLYQRHWHSSCECCDQLWLPQAGRDVSSPHRQIRYRPR